ncbi:MAG: polysaccharide biosynthesis tyrosine autokinase [Pseudomonadota bacterium]|nr:polysaccharide biosynthesis tyrosine autokinase [Pseudomonadota bacterium]
MAAPQGPSGPNRPHRPRRQLRDDDDTSLSEILHLRDYWRTVRKRLWTLITAFSLIVGSVTVVTLLTPQVFESTASLQIDSQPQANTSLSAYGQTGQGQYLLEQEYFSTQHKKLRSRVQARAVAERLDLANNPVYAELEPDELVQTLLNQVDIAPIKGTRLVWIYVRANDREFAALLCQTWAEVFVQRNMDEINQGVQGGLGWLSGAVTKAEEEFRQAEQALLDFRRKNNKIALSSQEEGNLLVQQLEELSRKRALAEAERAAREAEYDGLAASARTQKDLRRISLLVESPLMSGLREQLTTLQADREALMTRYLPDAPVPLVLQNKERLVDVELQIRSEVDAELGRRRAMLAQAQSTEEGLQRSIESLTKSALEENGEEANYNLLRRQVDSRAIIYKHLVEKSQEMDVTSSLKENNVRIIDPGEAGEKPVEPNYVRNIGVAILGGLLVGVSMALFFDYMDTTIKTREEVEALGLPFLGIIPSVPGLEGEGWEVARQRYLYALNYPKSAFAEFCRNIRTTVNFSAREDGLPPRRLLITSAGPREGKTTSSINLAITFASNGRRVCLVDADLRRPSLHHAFGLPNEEGFSTLIGGTSSVAAVSQPTPQEGLFIIPSGPRPPNPAEMLGSQACKDALDRLNEAFDLVIIDSPPVVAVTDAVVLANDVDGVILVVKSFKVARDLVLQAKRQLVDVEARLIGVILNNFDIQRKSYGYYYYYSYYGSDREDVGKGRT